MSQYLVNVSTSNVHLFYTEGDRIPTYSLTKNSGTLLVQQIAKDTRSDDMQIISFHPGAILSESARKVGYEESSLDWDDGNQFLIYFSMRTHLQSANVQTRELSRPICGVVCKRRGPIHAWPVGSGLVGR